MDLSKFKNIRIPSDSTRSDLNLMNDKLMYTGYPYGSARAQLTADELNRRIADQAKLKAGTTSDISTNIDYKALADVAARNAELMDLARQEAEFKKMLNANKLDWDIWKSRDGEVPTALGEWIVTPNGVSVTPSSSIPMSYLNYIQ